MHSNTELKDIFRFTYEDIQQNRLGLLSETQIQQHGTNSLQSRACAGVLATVLLIIGLSLGGIGIATQGFVLGCMSVFFIIGGIFFLLGAFTKKHLTEEEQQAHRITGTVKMIADFDGEKTTYYMRVQDTLMRVSRDQYERMQDGGDYTVYYFETIFQGVLPRPLAVEQAIEQPTPIEKHKKTPPDVKRKNDDIHQDLRLQNLQRVFNFTPEELQQNRKGKLTNGQRKQVTFRNITRLLLAIAIIGFCFLVGVSYFFLDEPSSDDQYNGIIMFGFGVFMLIALTYSVIKNIKTISKPVLKRAVGTINPIKDEDLIDSGTDYYLDIDGVRLKSNLKQYHMFRRARLESSFNEVSFAVYYVPVPNGVAKPLSIEPISKEQAQKLHPAADMFS